jgi:hypothetical protein
MNLQEARDLAIVFLAIGAFVVTLLLAIVAGLLWRLIGLIRHEIKPVLVSLQDTASTVKGTTSFVSDSFVSPLIRLSSVFAGLGGTLRSLISQSRSKEG